MPQYIIIYFIYLKKNLGYAYAFILLIQQSRLHIQKKKITYTLESVESVKENYHLTISRILSYFSCSSQI